MRIICIVGDMLEVYALPSVPDGACVLEERVCLPSLLLLQGCRTCWQFADTQSSSSEALELLEVSCGIIFSLDVDTMQLTRTEKQHTRQDVWRIFPYELPCCLNS